MFGITRWRSTAKTLSVSLVLAMMVNLWGGSALAASAAPLIAKADAKAATKLAGKVSEVSPPSVIQELRELMDQYQPQVSITSPKPNEVLQDNTVSVQFKVKDFPAFKNEKLGLGPHLHLFLDDQPYQAVYDPSQPFVLKDLAPGTHTIRAFAGRPWHESFKNDGAYAQTTFHVFTKTPNNNPNSELPLLTYSRPQGSYGAEPILLDFYLTNAPLHLVAQEDSKDDVPDWRIRVTVDGDSFTLDRWQPLYLKGFKPGKNWVQLEYIDEKGNAVQNVYNNTARIFTYEPNGQDALSKLVRGELSFEEARGIVDPNYKPAPKVIETPAPEASPVPVIPPVPVVPGPKAEEKPAVTDEKKIPETVPAPVEEAKPKGGFFNRFKRSAPKPSPSTAPVPSELSAPEEKKLEETKIPEVKETPEREEQDRLEQPSRAEEKPEAPIAPVVPIAPVLPAPAVKEAPKPKGGFFNRFKRSEPTPTASPSPSPAAEKEESEPPKAKPAPVVKETPKSEVARPSVKPSIAPVVIPSPEPKVEEKVKPEVEETPKPNFSDRFKRPEVKPSPVVLPSPEPKAEEKPQQPEVVEPKPAPAKKEAPKGGFFDRFKRSGSKPTPSVAPIASPSPAPKLEEKTKEPEPLKPTPAPAGQETPKVNFSDRFKRPEPKSSVIPVPSVSPAPKPSIEQSKPVEVKPAPEKDNLVDRLKRAEPKSSIVPSPSLSPIPKELTEEKSEKPEVTESKPAPVVKPSPKGSFFDRFKPTSKPAPKASPTASPIPDVLSAPEEAKPQVLETKPAQPVLKEAPKVENLRRVVPKPSTPPPAISAPRNLEETENPKIEEKEVEKPESVISKEQPKGGFFNRFRRPETTPKPVLPKPEEKPFTSEVKQPKAPATVEPPPASGQKVENTKPSIDLPRQPENLTPRSTKEIAKPSLTVAPSPEVELRSSDSDQVESTFKPRSELERRLGIPLSKLEEQTILAPEKSSIERPNTSKAPSDTLPANNF